MQFDNKISALWKNACPLNGHTFLCNVMSQSELTTPVLGSILFRHNSPQKHRIIVLIEISFTSQKIEAKEAIVAPTFTDLKIRRKFPNDVLRRIADGRQIRTTVTRNDSICRTVADGTRRTLVYHLNSVLVPDGKTKSKQ